MNIIKQINPGYSFILFLLLIIPETNAQTTLLIQPSGLAGKDAYVSGLAAEDSMNFGSDPELKATSYGGKRIYLYFDFSQIPANATVLSAKIKLFAAGAGHTVSAANSISVYSVLQPWNEDLITYSNQPSFNNIPDAVLPSPDSAMQNYSIDVRPKMQSFVTAQTTGYGFLLKLNYLGSLNFASSDNADPSLRPALEIVYGVCTSSPPPATISPSPTTTICKGDSVTYVANAGVGYYYEWYRNGISKVYGNSNAYTTSQSGNYLVAVTDSTGCKTFSSVSTLYVTLENAKVTHHNNATYPACVNGGVQLKATGGVGFTYHWHKDSVPVNDFDSLYFTSDTGYYSCQISAGNCVIMTNTVRGVVYKANVKKYSPERICVGPSTVAVDLVNFNYYPNSFQWENFTNSIPGATSSQYDVPASGNYRCKITTSDCTSPVYTNIQSMYIGVQPNLVLYSYPGGVADPISLCPGYYGQLYVRHADGFYFNPDSTTQFQWYYNFPSQYLGDDPYIDVSGTYDETGVYNAFVITGCGYSDLYKGINITGQGKPDLQIISNSLCDSVRLEVPYNSNLYNYRKWNAYQWLRNGIPLSADTMYYIYAKQSGSYACLLTNDCDTVTTDPVQAIVLNDYAIITSTDTTICDGQSRLLTANSNPGIGTYKWFRNGNLISTGTSAYHAAQSGTYYCEIGGTCGTFISNSITLTVIPSPTSTVTVSDPPYCIQGPVLLSTAVQSNVTYQWIKNNVAIQGANQSSFSADINGYYQVRVTLYNGCTEKSDSLRIIVDSLKPQITSNAVMPACKGYNVALNLNPMGSYYSIQWFKNNVPVTNANQLNLYTIAEEADYYAILTNICGTITSDVFHISVRNSNSSLTAIGDTVFCGNDSVLLVANNINASLYQWYNNNSSYATTTIPEYYAKYSGTYYINYYDTIIGCYINTNSVSVSSSGGINYKMSCGTPEWSGCGSLALSVNAASGDTIVWKKNNVVIPGASSVTYNAVSSGNYEAVISNSCGSFRTKVEKVRIDTVVISPSFIHFASSGVLPCIGNPYSIQIAYWWLPGNGADIDSFQWRYNGSVIPGASNTVYYPTQSGVYTLDVINACGVSTSPAASVTLYPKPDPLIITSGPTTFCGDSVTLSAGTGYIYQWYFNSTKIPGATSSDLIASATGTYYCVMNSGFCDTTSQYTNIYNSGQSAVVINNGIDELCVDSSVMLQAFPNNSGLSYQWKKDGISIPGAITNNYFVVDTGTYSCELSGICGNVISNSFNYSSFSSKPRTPAGIFGNSKACSGDILNFSIVSPGGYDYNWSVPGGVVLVNGQGTSSVTTNFNQQFQGGLISVSASNACGTSAKRHLMIEKNLPMTPSVISGPITGLCGGASKVYSVNQAPGANNYHWSVPTNAIVTSGQGSASVAIKFRTGFTNGNLTVYTTNNCGNSDTSSLFLSGRPLKPGLISGPVSVCAMQQNLNYTIAPVASATSYSWFYPSDAYVTSGSGSTSLALNFGSSAGAVGVRANNSCGSGLYRMLHVDVVCREEDDKHAEVKVYPIPTRDEFTMEIAANVVDYDLKITDISGRIVMKEKVTNSNLYRFGKNLVPGVYYLTIITSEFQKSLVIIKTDGIID